MKLAIGADHGGFKLKNKLVRFLEASEYLVADLGTHSAQSCDYPKIGMRLARSVAQGQFPRGILICKSGIGMSIAANKVPGARAALCLSVKQARMSREHNNANILCLSANFTGFKDAQKMVAVWLKTDFAGGRHARRLKQISSIEKACIKARTKSKASKG